MNNKQSNGFKRSKSNGFFVNSFVARTKPAFPPNEPHHRQNTRKKVGGYMKVDENTPRTEPSESNGSPKKPPKSIMGKKPKKEPEIKSGTLYTQLAHPIPENFRTKLLELKEHAWDSLDRDNEQIVKFREEFRTEMQDVFSSGWVQESSEIFNISVLNDKLIMVALGHPNSIEKIVFLEFSEFSKTTNFKIKKTFNFVDKAALENRERYELYKTKKINTKRTFPNKPIQLIKEIFVTPGLNFMFFFGEEHLCFTHLKGEAAKPSGVVQMDVPRRNTPFRWRDAEIKYWDENQTLLLVNCYQKDESHPIFIRNQKSQGSMFDVKLGFKDFAIAHFEGGDKRRTTKVINIYTNDEHKTLTVFSIFECFPELKQAFKGYTSDGVWNPEFARLSSKTHGSLLIMYNAMTSLLCFLTESGEKYHADKYFSVANLGFRIRKMIDLKNVGLTDHSNGSNFIMIPDKRAMDRRKQLYLITIFSNKTSSFAMKCELDLIEVDCEGLAAKKLYSRAIMVPQSVISLPKYQDYRVCCPSRDSLVIVDCYADLLHELKFVDNFKEIDHSEYKFRKLTGNIDIFFDVRFTPDARSVVYLNSFNSIQTRSLIKITNKSKEKIYQRIVPLSKLDQFRSLQGEYYANIDTQSLTNEAMSLLGKKTQNGGRAQNYRVEENNVDLQMKFTQNSQNVFIFKAFVTGSTTHDYKEIYSIDVVNLKDFKYPRRRSVEFKRFNHSKSLFFDVTDSENFSIGNENFFGVDLYKDWKVLKRTNEKLKFHVSEDGRLIFMTGMVNHKELDIVVIWKEGVRTHEKIEYEMLNYYVKLRGRIIDFKSFAFGRTLVVSTYKRGDSSLNIYHLKEVRRTSQMYFDFDEFSISHGLKKFDSISFDFDQKFTILAVLAYKKRNSILTVWKEVTEEVPRDSGEEDDFEVETKFVKIQSINLKEKIKKRDKVKMLKDGKYLFVGDKFFLRVYEEGSSGDFQYFMSSKALKIGIVLDIFNLKNENLLVIKSLNSLSESQEIGQGGDYYNDDNLPKPQGELLMTLYKLDNLSMIKLIVLARRDIYSHSESATHHFEISKYNGFFGQIDFYPLETDNKSRHSLSSVDLDQGSLVEVQGHKQNDLRPNEIDFSRPFLKITQLLKFNYFDVNHEFTQIFSLDTSPDKKYLVSRDYLEDIINKGHKMLLIHFNYEYYEPKSRRHDENRSDFKHQNSMRNKVFVYFFNFLYEFHAKMNIPYLAVVNRSDTLLKKFLDYFGYFPGLYPEGLDPIQAAFDVGDPKTTEVVTNYLKKNKSAMSLFMDYDKLAEAINSNNREMQRLAVNYYMPTKNKGSNSLSLTKSIKYYPLGNKKKIVYESELEMMNKVIHSKLSEQVDQAGRNKEPSVPVDIYITRSKFSTDIAHKSCFEMISAFNNLPKELLEGNIRYVIDHIWDENLFKRVIWFVFIQSASFVVYCTHIVFVRHRLGLMIASVSLAVLNLAFEIISIFSNYRSYFNYFTNFIDLWVYTSAAVLSALVYSKTLPCNNSDDPCKWYDAQTTNKFWNFYINLSIITLGFRALAGLRIYDIMRYITSMVNKVFYDIRGIVGIFFFIVGVFMIAGYNVPSGFEGEARDPVMPKSSEVGLRRLFLEFDYNYRAWFWYTDDPTEFNASQYLIFFSSGVFISIIMANLVIGMIGTTFGRVEDKKHLYDTLQILDIMNEYGTILSVLNSKDSISDSERARMKHLCLIVRKQEEEVDKEEMMIKELRSHVDDRLEEYHRKNMSMLKSIRLSGGSSLRGPGLNGNAGGATNRRAGRQKKGSGEIYESELYEDDMRALNTGGKTGFLRSLFGTGKKRELTVGEYNRKRQMQEDINDNSSASIDTVLDDSSYHSDQASVGFT